MNKTEFPLAVELLKANIKHNDMFSDKEKEAMQSELSRLEGGGWVKKPEINNESIEKMAKTVADAMYPNDAFEWRAAKEGYVFGFNDGVLTATTPKTK